MILLPPMPVKVWLLALFSFIYEITADINIGSFYECAHSLSGQIWVKSDREIVIHGFNYDGTGPAAWFHGQLRPAAGISNADPKKYVTLPFPWSSCDRLQVGRSYQDETISLILPRSVKEFETIGILCYEFCHNFGHIIIPADLIVPAAPGDLGQVSECPKPSFPACSRVNGGELKPNCRGGNTSWKPTKMPGDGQSGSGNGMKETHLSSGALQTRILDFRLILWIMGTKKVFGHFIKCRI